VIRAERNKFTKYLSPNICVCVGRASW